MKTETKLNKTAFYTQIANKLASAMEAGTAPWVRPWRKLGAHRNGSTQRSYSGINSIQLLLWAIENNFHSHEWYTFKQAKELGGSVVKGSTGIPIIFFSPLWVDEDGNRIKAEQANEESRYIPMAKFFYVFNRDQIEGLAEPASTVITTNTIGDSIVSNSGVDLRVGGGVAGYSMTGDFIRMPDTHLFNDDGGYWATLYHELGHWTGHESRLARKLTRYNDDKEAYAQEELVAELTSAFLCAESNVDGDLQHAEYLSMWAEVVKARPSYLAIAVSEAQKAASFLLEFSESNRDAA